MSRPVAVTGGCECEDGEVKVDFFTLFLVLISIYLWFSWIRDSRDTLGGIPQIRVRFLQTMSIRLC